MTRDGWRDVILSAAVRSAGGKHDALDLLADLLAEQDAAKNALRELGYGVIGTPWPNVVRAIARAVRYQPEPER